MTTAPRLTIDLVALAANWRLLSGLSPDAETAAVVKADAYGLGIEQAVPVLAEAGCETFFVAMVEEGVRVRRCLPDAKIYVLNGIFSDAVRTAMEHSLAPVLSTHEQLAFWTSAAGGKPCAIQVDTGMNRLGLSMKDAEKLAANGTMVRKSGAELLMSHLACADEPGHALNALQLSRFQEIANQFSGLRPSLANSAAVLSNPAMHFDLTRPGIALYGAEAVNDFPNPMQPVVKAETRILQIRTVRKGETVGYGAAFKAERDLKLAVCSAGYADGYHRASSGAGVPLRNAVAGGGHGFLEGIRVPLTGRVSMDLVAFDVSQVPESDLENARWIELFGPNILIDDAARAAGTIGYELLTGLGNRYLRNYLR